jgi:hypothetical protein
MTQHSWWLSYRDLNLRCSSKQLPDRLGDFTSQRKHCADTMVLSMLVAIIAAPGLLGSQEAIRQSQSQEKREEHRARRCNLVVTCVKSSPRSRELNGRLVVLRNGKLWIDTGTDDGAPLGHPYAGYYLPYPDSKYEGLVTTITDVAPIMNWIYIDKETHEVKYGVRLDAQPNLTGPFDCTRQDRRMTFDAWEGWCAVEEAPGLWALYFDVTDDGLKSKVAPGTRVLEIELNRKEKRFQKETEARQQDQTTKRAVDAQQDAPVDQPLAAEALVSKPGVVDETPQAQAEPSKPKPFRIPKSIFENPPPTLETSTFERPLTPPPAYTTTAPPVSSAVNIPATVSSSVNPRRETDTIPDTTPSFNEGPERPAQPSSSIAPPQARYAPPSITSSSRSISPPTSQSNPVSEKRTTPRLNRNSGSRALAKAQMFEAMAAGQRTETNRRVSRANSNASGSEYSRDSQDISEEVIAGPEIVPATSPTPAPLAPASVKTRPLLGRAEKSTPPTYEPPIEPAQRPKTPTRQRALTNPMDPAIFGQGPQPRTGSREPVRRTSKPSTTPTARTSISRSSSQASTQGARMPSERRGTGTERTGSPRAPVRTVTEQASSPRLPTRTPTEQASSPRTTSQANRGATRSSLASTMTTGRGNRAMTTKMGGSAERGRQGRSAMLSPAQGRAVAGRKTTSALFRDIDALVNQDVGGKTSND